MMDRLRILLRHYEGLVLKRYLDVNGYPTIGIGHKLDAADLTETCTFDEADWWFEQDLEKAAKRCQLFIPHWNLLNDVRQVVLISMTFQMGMGSPGRKGVLGFVDMITALRAQDYVGAAVAMLDSKWHRLDSPKRAEEEAAMMMTGEWPEWMKNEESPNAEHRTVVQG